MHLHCKQSIPMRVCLGRAFQLPSMLVRSRFVLPCRTYTAVSSAQPKETQSLALPGSEDDSTIRQKYRPFLCNNDPAEDWVKDLELNTALSMVQQNLQTTNDRLKVLVLYGSLRRRSYSKLVALEASRILFRLGCDVRVFDPEELPMKNDSDHGHPKVQELRELSKWSDGHIWVSPEQHGNLVNQHHLNTGHCPQY